MEKMESEEKADISTLEKTGHLYFGPTPTGKLARPVGLPAAWRRLLKLYGPMGAFGGIWERLLEGLVAG